jgi:hypothetical protein
MKGKMCCSRRRECTRRDRRACGGPPWTGGSHGPVAIVSIICKWRLKVGMTYVFGCGVALEVRLDRLVLLVELGQVGYEVLDDVSVRKRVDARLLLLLSRNAACPNMLVHVLWRFVLVSHVHKHASVLTPSMFIAQLPQMPSLQLLLNVRVGSISFLILISASSIMGPVLFRSRV